MRKLFFIVFIFNSVYAQPPGEWMWIHGTNIPTDTGNWGTQGVTSPSNVPPSVYEPCEWKDLNGNFWFYGGIAPSAMYSALWKYEPSTNQWTWMKGPNTPTFAGNYGVQGVPSPANLPPAKGFAVSTWTDLQGNLWMFGGAEVGSFSDLWKYEISTNQWTWMKGPTTLDDPGIYGTQGVPSPANNPPARSECAATWTDNSGNLWMFGGMGFSGRFNDLWKYEIATNTWTWMKGSSLVDQLGVYGTQGVENPANTPGARAVFSHWQDNSGNFWLFGGTQPAGSFNDLWRYNPSTNNWAWMSGSSQPYDSGYYGTRCIVDSSNMPSARHESRACWTDPNGNFWLFGGYDGETVNDLWMYCLASNQWIWVSGDTIGNPPGNWGTINVASPANVPNGRFGS